jgi:hypothetical protein
MVPATVAVIAPVIIGDSFGIVAVGTEVTRTAFVAAVARGTGILARVSAILTVAAFAMVRTSFTTFADRFTAVFAASITAGTGSAFTAAFTLFAVFTQGTIGHVLAARAHLTLTDSVTVSTMVTVDYGRGISDDAHCSTLLKRVGPRAGTIGVVAGSFR